MLVDFLCLLTTFDNKEIHNQESKALTLGMVAVEALLMPFNNEKDLSGAEKMDRWILAQKIHKSSSPVEITKEDSDLIKKLVGQAYGPVVVGPVWTLLGNN